MSFVKILNTDGIVNLTLNRPEKRNALNGEFIYELLNILRELDRDSTCRVLLINGTGKHFCAGVDIVWMQKIGVSSEEENLYDAEQLADLLFHLYTFSKPTIALAHGSIMGGGLGIVAACDIAIATRDASFGFPEVKMGLIPAIISPYVLRAIGERAARFHFLMGQPFPASEAYRLGLIYECVEKDRLLESGMILAEQLKKNGPTALAKTKKLIQHVTNEKLTNTLSQYTAAYLARLRASSEAQEGLHAFVEKRAPVWRT